MIRMTYTIVAIILAVSVFRLFDLHTLKFRNTGLGIVYLIALVVSAFFLIKGKSTPGSTGN